MPTSRATNIKAPAKGKTARATTAKTSGNTGTTPAKNTLAKAKTAPNKANGRIAPPAATDQRVSNKAANKAPTNKTPVAARPAVKPTPKSAADRELRRRRIRFGLGLSAVVVLGTAGVSAFVYPGFAIAPPVVAAASALQIPAPLLARTAQERIGEQTALVAALPDQVGIWVQSGISGYMGWLNDEVVEAWNITYLDGVTQGEGADEQPISVHLTVGQWPTPIGSEASKARLFYESQTKGLGGVLLKGNVKVGDSTTGQYMLLVDRPDGLSPVGDVDLSQIPGDAQGVMWWRNGTVVVKAVGPISVLPDFFSAFPL